LNQIGTDGNQGSVSDGNYAVQAGDDYVAGSHRVTARLEKGEAENRRPAWKSVA